MRRTKTKRLAKKLVRVRSTVKRSRKSAARTQTTAMAVKLPFVEAPATQVIIALEEPQRRSVSPLVVWSALPFALMRMMLGTRHAARQINETLKTGAV